METKELTIDQQINSLSDTIYDTLDKCKEGLDKIVKLREKLNPEDYSQSSTFLFAKKLHTYAYGNYYTKALWIHESIIEKYMRTLIEDSYNHGKTI